MSKAESGQSYDLEEEHTTIRELLRNEMRRRGFEPPPATSTGEGTRGERRHSSEGGRRRQQTQRKKVELSIALAFADVSVVGKCTCSLSVLYMQ